MNQINNDKIRHAVRERYGKVAESDNSGCGNLPDEVKKDMRGTS